jgi:hypothetical protein
VPGKSIDPIDSTGGLGLYVAGIMEWILGNTFPFTVRDRGEILLLFCGTWTDRMSLFTLGVHDFRIVLAQLRVLEPAFGRNCGRVPPGRCHGDVQRRYCAVPHQLGLPLLR